MDGPLMDWFDEIDLDPAAHPVSMGTRTLGERPWLISDHKRADELALKKSLLSSNRSAVFHVTPACDEPARDVCRLIQEAGINAPATDSEQHPLETAATAVQEDLVLLDQRPDGWHLNSAALCFPTRWTLADKVDKHIAAVHAPVSEYDTRIANRVDRLFDRLTDRPVWRRNWFLMTDPSLFQPFPTPIEHVEATDVAQSMWVRSERQTLRMLPGGWILFTIRVQQELLSDLLDTDERLKTFTTWTHDVPVEISPQRHLMATQRAALLHALHHRTAHGSWPHPQGTAE